MHRWIILTALTLVSAQPSSPDDLIRDGNAAFEREDFATADRLYQEAMRQGTDPGLITFNQGIILMRREQFAVAEQAFRRSLDDAAAPDDRRARAWFNLGNCVLRRSESPTIAQLRTAMTCYRHCLDVNSDSTLAEHASHNLELVKWLWREAREREPQPDDPNRDPPEAKNLPNPKPPMAQNQGPEPGTEPMGSNNDPSNPMPNGAAPKSNGPPRVSDQKPTPGAGKLPVLLDTDALQPLTADQTTDSLHDAAERLLRERRNRSRAATPGERPDVRNW